MNKSRSVKNSVKNASLVALCLLMLLLCVASWLSGLGIAQMPADSLLRRVHDHMFGGASGYELRSSGVAAADPAQVALTVDGQLTAVQYSLSEVDAGVQAVRTVWSEALGGGSTLDAVEEDEFDRALAAGDCALLHYDGAIPVSAIAGWFGGRWENDLAVRTLLYAAGENRLYVRGADGALYAAGTKVDSGSWQNAQREFRGQPCAFSGKQYAVLPETLLFDRETLSFPLLMPAENDLFGEASDVSLQTLLSAFSYTPHARFYPEQDDTIRVFVDNASTLRISGGGEVQYTASGTGGTVFAYEEGKADGVDALDAQIDCARLVLDTALRATDAETRGSLYAVQQTSGLTTLVFMQTYNGVPVLSGTDFATFVFRDGALVSATVSLQKFLADDTRQTVMPAKQAAVSATESQNELIVAYRMQDGVYRPARYFLAGSADAATTDS